MWHRLTSAWTDAHLTLIAAAAMLASLGTLAVGGSATAPDVAISTLAIAFLTFVLASLTDAFGGMLVGLVAAAALTPVHQYLPTAHPAGFGAQAVTLGLLFLLGMSSGLAADRVRRSRRIAARGSGHAILPVEGSLGLMAAGDAALALAHEQARAELHQRPLTTATVRVAFTDTSLAEEEVRRARRAVARSLETELRVTDILYVDTEGQLGAILPETDLAAAVDVVESALIVARAATFADRQAGHRKPVADVAELVVELTPMVEPVVQPAAPPASPKPARPPARRKPRTSESRSTTTKRKPTERLEAH